nr:GntR family transcriptional regulator [Rhizobium sp. ACO-34A]
MVESKESERALNLKSEILEIAAESNLVPGDRLFEARIAKRLGVSRAPVRANLNELCELGIVTTIANKGFVLDAPIDGSKVQSLLGKGSAFEQLYMRLADDHLDGTLPPVVTEQELLRRYDVGEVQLRRVLDRAVTSGWLERSAGYGWRFSEVLRHPDAYADMMRLRAMIEPATLLEPRFSISAEVLANLRTRQEDVLAKGISSYSNPDLFKYGCEFHELLVAASCNQFALETLRRLNARRRLFVYRARNDDRLRADIEEHLEILDLIERNDLDAASHRMRLHLCPADERQR